MKSNISPAVKKQITIINDKMEKLIDRIAKNNADNLHTLCEISVLLQNIEISSKESIETNKALLN